ncbi:rod shape-determining protein MreC [Altererythrobacter aurantiacus]|uniref:Cell shape-determining protein MreC n=1 Tax=Parapontixanthobacter aurantiacus TaxID=1463599 RepID=A0A844ZDF8_9SPHN|nr:rod shape-determining protein MreC [Parapontixanthobacter aurantiacus]
MAPPASRRSSYSKRAQLSVFTGYVVAGIGAVLGAILLILSIWRPDLPGNLRASANDVTTPATSAAAEVRTGSKGFLESVQGYLRAGAQNAELKREMELARIRLAEADAVRLENRRLRALMNLQETDSAPVAVTRMVGSTSSSARRFGYIGAGSSDGVTIGMPVRTARGVVGRVLEVGLSNSRILLITDSQSVLPIRLSDERRNIVAFASGNGDGRLRVRLINLGINPLEPGDLFVTSGAGGYYQPSVAVALVEEVIDDGAIARVVSDPAASDFVAVMPIFQPEAVRAARTADDQRLGEDEGNSPDNPAGEVPAEPAPMPDGAE